MKSLHPVRRTSFRTECPFPCLCILQPMFSQMAFTGSDAVSRSGKFVTSLITAKAGNECFLKGSWRTSLNFSFQA